MFLLLLISTHEVKVFLLFLSKSEYVNLPVSRRFVCRFGVVSVCFFAVFRLAVWFFMLLSLI